MWPPWAMMSRATQDEHCAACRGRAEGRVGSSVSTKRGVPVSTGPGGLTGSRPRGRTVVWGEGVIDRIEAEHGRLDGMDLGPRARGVVVGHAVFVPKDHGCVALVKLADRAGLGE